MALIDSSTNKKSKKNQYNLKQSHNALKHAWLFLLYTIKTKYPYRIKLQNTDKMWSSNRSHLHQPTLDVKRTRPPVDICFIWNFIIKKKKKISKHWKCQKPNRTWKLQLVCIVINLFQYFIWPNFRALSMFYSPIENLPLVETAHTKSPTSKCTSILPLFACCLYVWLLH